MRGFLFYRLERQFGFNKSTYVSFLVQAQRNLQVCFYVAMRLKNPRLLGVVLLYFGAGVSPFAFLNLRLRKRRINCGELLSSKAAARYTSPLQALLMQILPHLV